MSDNLAEEFRKAGIGVGDVVEMANFTDSIDRAIGGVIGEETPLMNGWLVEVTAIGKMSVLGFILVGKPIKEDETGTAYKLFKWTKSDVKETQFRGQKVFRKIGRMGLEHAFALTCPDLENIYTRCQRKTA